MPNWLTKLKLSAIALVDRGANPDAHVTLAKRDDTQKNEEKGYGSMEECMGALKDAGKCKELMAAMKRAIDQGDGMSDKLPEEVTKALAEVADLKKRAEAAEAQAKTAEADAKAAKEQVAKMEDQRQREVFIAKAQDYTALPGVTADDFGPILRKIAGALSEDEMKKLDATLRGAVKIAQDAAHFQELGSGTPATGSAEDKLNQLANAMVQKDGKLTFAQAFTKVCDTPDGKKLYRQVQDEQERDRANGGRRVR